MVEVEVRKTQTDTEQIESTSLDINEIIGKVRTFVDSIREMSPDGEPMKVSVEGFNVSLGKDHGEYELALKVNLLIKPKTVA